MAANKEESVALHRAIINITETDSAPPEPRNGFIRLKKAVSVGIS